MGEHRTHLDDSVADIGLGTVLMLVGLLIGAPAANALLSELFRLRGLDLGLTVQSVGAILLALFGIRFLARGLVRLFYR